jgi:hypothetical protein
MKSCYYAYNLRMLCALWKSNGTLTATSCRVTSYQQQACTFPLEKVIQKLQDMPGSEIRSRDARCSWHHYENLVLLMRMMVDHGLVRIIGQQRLFDELHDPASTSRLAGIWIVPLRPWNRHQVHTLWQTHITGARGLVTFIHPQSIGQPCHRKSTRVQRRGMRKPTTGTLESGSWVLRANMLWCMT